MSAHDVMCPAGKLFEVADSFFEAWLPERTA